MRHFNSGGSGIIDARATATGGVITHVNGGLLAQPSNIGHFSSSRFGAVPQLQLTAGYEFTRHLKAIAGHNFLYATNLFRAADTIDTRINPTQFGGGTLVGPAFPVFRGHASQFVAQGLSAGLQWAY